MIAWIIGQIPVLKAEIEAAKAAAAAAHEALKSESTSSEDSSPYITVPTTPLQGSADSPLEVDLEARGRRGLPTPISPARGNDGREVLETVEGDSEVQHGNGRGWASKARHFSDVYTPMFRKRSRSCDGEENTEGGSKERKRQRVE